MFLLFAKCRFRFYKSPCMYLLWAYIKKIQHFFCYVHVQKHIITCWRPVNFVLKEVTPLKKGVYITESGKEVDSCSSDS